MGSQALINPVIESRERDGSGRGRAACPLPGIFAEVERSRSITVSALDADGQPISFEASGLKARVVQHELDHLDGVLFIDRLPPGHAGPHQEEDPEGRLPRGAPRTTPSRSSRSGLRVLFYGTPAFALPTLDGLLAHHHVVAVSPSPIGRRDAASP